MLKKLVISNRWFILACAFFVLNLYGIVLFTVRSNASRDVRVALDLPEDGIARKQQPIAFRFSADMARTNEVGVWTHEGPVAFTPETAGKYCWQTPYELIFRPDAQWTTCAEYRAAVDDTLRSLDRRPLTEVRVLTFRAPALALSQASTVRTDSGPGIRLYFNAPVAVDEVRSHLEVRCGDDKPLRFRLDRIADTRTTDIILGQTELTTATIKLSKGLRGTQGPLGLTSDVSRNISLGTDLKLSHIRPRTAGLQPGSLLVTFTAPIDLDDATAFIRTEPELKLTVEPYYSYGRDSRYVFRGDFAAGRSYAVTFVKGLPSTTGYRLRDDVTRTVYFPDAGPELKLATKGHYMTPAGNMLVPLRLLNVKQYSLTIRRIFANNLVPLAARRERRYGYFCGKRHRGLTAVVARDTRKLTFTPNKAVDTAISLRPLIKDLRGAFHLEVVSKDGASDDHYFIVSDTGLSVRQNKGNLLIWANSLRELTPVSGADITVLSLQNQPLASGKTDAQGLLSLNWPHDEDAPPFIVTAEKGDDLTYLSLDRSRVFEPGAAGYRPYLREGYEACIFTDRGIYRPGSTCRVRTIVRAANLECPKPFPVQLTVYRPDGRSMKTETQLLNEFGSSEFAIEWPDYAATGRYHLEIGLPGEDGQTLGGKNVQVEMFAPPKIKVSAESRGERLSAEDNYRFTVSANHLFGSPAAGLPIDADIEYTAAAFKHDKWPDCVFGDSRRPFSAIRKKEGRRTLNSEGCMVYARPVPRGLRPPSMIRATFSATVTEPGGRGVTAYARCDVDVYPFYLGLNNPPTRLPAGRPVDMEVVAVNSDGSPHRAAKRLSVRFEKLTWTSILRKNSDGRYRYVSEEHATTVAEEAMGLSDGADKITITPPHAGHYRIGLEDERAGTAVSHEFYAAPETQAALAWSMEKPNRVDIIPDRKAYAPGETAELLVRSPFAGRALFTLETDEIHERRVLVLTNNSCTIDVPLVAAHAPNAYCTLSVIRPVVAEKTWGQHRAVGRVSLPLKQPERQLGIELETVTELRPRTPLKARVTVRDHTDAPVAAEFTVAAVDEGICMLTDFKTPDPFCFFTAQRMPSISLSDLYASLMPELEEGLLGTASRPGGGGAARHRRLNPVQGRRFRPVALWVGTTRTDSNGVADVTLDVPEFTGRLRLMAVAVNREAFGSTDSNVIVRRPLIVQPGLPRFLAPGDRAEMAIDLINESGQAGDVRVTVNCEGPLRIDDSHSETDVRVEDGASHSLKLRLHAAKAAGLAKCTIAAVMGQERFEETIELPVRPASALATHTLSGSIGPGTSHSPEFPSEWLAGTGETTLWLSSLPSLKLAGGLDYLVRYPHGCLEQTTSQSFPLLYLADLAQELYPGWLAEDAVNSRVQAGIDRILSMQRYDGSFSLWSSGPAYVWGTVYATHFLTEASQAGHAVPDHAHRGALDHLEKWLSRGAFGRNGHEPNIYNASYACFVLARAGRPRHGWMARIREQLPNLHRGTRVNTAAAYLAAGKRRDAAELLDGLVEKRPHDIKRELGGSLRSNERDDAILLSTWLGAAPDSPLVPLLAQRLEKARTAGRWYTTQDNAMALMAMGKYCRMAAGKRRPIDATVAWAEGHGTKTVKEVKRARIDLAGEAAGRASIRNNGDGTVYYYLKTSGIPLEDTAPEADKGIVVRRSFYNSDGLVLDPSQIKQGDLIVIAVELESGDTVDNIVVEDLLPAGLEVENARLKTSKTLHWVKKRQTLPVAWVDSRDDRVLLYTSSFQGKKAYFYAARAVTPGRFIWPAVAAECMYDEAIRSRHGRRELIVE